MRDLPAQHGTGGQADGMETARLFQPRMDRGDRGDRTASVSAKEPHGVAPEQVVFPYPTFAGMNPVPRSGGRRMSCKSGVAGSVEDRERLKALSCSRERGEADRSRAILLTLTGWTAGRIAQAFGVREDTVRQWPATLWQAGLRR